MPLSLYTKLFYAILCSSAITDGFGFTTTYFIRMQTDHPSLSVPFKKKSIGID